MQKVGYKQTKPAIYLSSLFANAANPFGGATCSSSMHYWNESTILIYIGSLISLAVCLRLIVQNVISLRVHMGRGQCEVMLTYNPIKLRCIPLRTLLHTSNDTEYLL